MPVWILLLTPFLVLPIVVLFRFVGCGHTLEISPEEPETVPAYRDYILGGPHSAGTVKNPGVKPNPAQVIAYWRLVEIPTDLIAHDEKQFQDGEYRWVPALPPIAPTATVTGSEAAQGDFFTGQQSLIKSDTGKNCRKFNGAFVSVPYKAGLYTGEFTIEAWIKPEWNLTKGYQHVLFSAGGHYRKRFDSAGESYHGFTVYADVTDGWQVRLAPGFETLTPSPMVSHAAPSHIAVTVANDPTVPSKKKVTLFLDAKEMGSMTVNYYSLPDEAPLFIGIQNSEVDPSKPLQPTAPILSMIQEVVLHSVALSKEEIENHVSINRV